VRQRERIVRHNNRLRRNFKKLRARRRRRTQERVYYGRGRMIKRRTQRVAGEAVDGQEHDEDHRREWQQQDALLPRDAQQVVAMIKQTPITHDRGRPRQRRIVGGVIDAKREASVGQEVCYLPYKRHGARVETTSRVVIEREYRTFNGWVKETKTVSPHRVQPVY
jgi:hypothetical protein